MSAWCKYMKPIAIVGGTTIGMALLALAVTAGGCESRPFAKKSARKPEATAHEKSRQDVSRQELDELLSIK